MLQSIFLGGKERPVIFAHVCFRKLKEEKGIGLDEFGIQLSGGDISLLADVVCYGLKAGQIKQGGALDTFDADQVASWLDDDIKTTPVLLEMLTTSIYALKGIEPPKVEDEPAEGAKKKKAALSGAN